MQLKPSCVFNVPLQAYNNDFTFYVNGEEFKTSRLVSDLLSPVICSIHSCDPTLNSFTINTKSSGNFSHILELTKFNQINFPEKEFPFISEIIHILGMDSLEFEEVDESAEITTDNVFLLLKKRLKIGQILPKKITAQIEFIASHFTELYQSQEEEFFELPIDVLFEIFSSTHFKLNSEDQLIQIINKLYSKNVNYSILYENVLFENVTSKSIQNFLNIFDSNYMTKEIWKRLSKRLEMDVKIQTDTNRYCQSNEIVVVNYSADNKFNGIIKYLKDKNSGNIDEIIKVTSNSFHDQNHLPKNLLNPGNEEYWTEINHENAFVCFEFKNYEIEISNYSIKSSSFGKNKGNVKNWTLEVSNDGKNWDIIDTQSNYSELNSPKSEKTFYVQSNGFYRFCRFHHKGNFWGINSPMNYSLKIAQIEFYGKIKSI